MRRLGLWAVVALVLVVANAAILDKERVLRDGRVVLLELAPVDPRSLLQGDYMALRYALANEVARERSAETSADGHLVVRIGEGGVARFLRFHDGSQLSGDEQLLRYRKRGQGVRIASDAFFFEEGTDSLYDNARYGELRVAEDGDAVLVGLRDGALQLLGER